jgi:hypothetical protein
MRLVRPKFLLKIRARFRGEPMHVFKLSHQTEDDEERDRRESAPSPAEIIKDDSDLELRDLYEWFEKVDTRLVRESLAEAKTTPSRAPHFRWD